MAPGTDTTQGRAQPGAKDPQDPRSGLYAASGTSVRPRRASSRDVLVLLKGSETTGTLPTKGLELSEGSGSIAEPRGCGIRTRAERKYFGTLEGEVQNQFIFFFLS